MTSPALGIVLVVAAAGLFAYAQLAAPVARIPKGRRQMPGDTPTSTIESLSRAVVGETDRILRRRGWVPFGRDEIDRAGLKLSAASLVVIVALIALAGLVVGLATTHLVVAVLLAAAAPVGAKLYLKVRTTRRNKAFADQLEEILQMLAASLRAGHSLPRAFDLAARDALSPMSEELARIVNENRLGRDLVDAMHRTSDRMDSEDFRWITQAVAIHRDTGGNLNEILDRVAETIRERNQLRQEIHALAADGRISTYVLMALPVVLGTAYSLFNPGYMAPLFTTGTGWFLLGVSVVLFGVGGLWFRAIVNVKF